MATTPSIILLDRSYVPAAGDVHIQNPKPPVGCFCIDPQHGGHRPPECPGIITWPPIEPGDSACSFALRLRLGGSFPRMVSGKVVECRIVLPGNASLDSWVAAALLLFPSSETAVFDVEMRARVMALAAADNGAVCAARGVATQFSGLARLCAAPMGGRDVLDFIPAPVKIACLQGWLATGQVALPNECLLQRLMALGGALEKCPDLSIGVRLGGDLRPVREWGGDILPALNAVATAEREASYAACTVQLTSRTPDGREMTVANVQLMESCPFLRYPPIVALVISGMSGLSGGRGAFAVGYRYAPVVIAYSPSGDPRVPIEHRGPICTIGRATNARSVNFPGEQICAALDEAERAAWRDLGNSEIEQTGGVHGPCAPAGTWGGQPLVKGSPKPAGQWQGTRLSPERIAEIVRGVLAEVPR